VAPFIFQRFTHTPEDETFVIVVELARFDRSAPKLPNFRLG
jgi:hypothetical protein